MFKPYKEVIEHAQAVYQSSSDEDALKVAFEELREVLLLPKGELLDDLRADGTALAYRMRLKMMFLDCILCEFSDAKLSEVATLAQMVQTESEKKDFKNTAALARAVTAAITSVKLLVHELNATYLVIQGTEDKKKLKESMLADFVRNADDTIAMVHEADFGKLFDRSFPDINESLSKMLESHRAKVLTILSSNEEYAYGSDYKRMVTVKKCRAIIPFTFYPCLFNSDRSGASVHVVCSPFEDEFDLLVASVTKGAKCDLVRIDLGELSHAKDKKGAWDYAVKQLSVMRDCKFVVYGMQDVVALADSLLSGFLEIIAGTGQDIYVFDTSPDRLLFRAMSNGTKTNKKASVAYYYLSMPSYLELTELFRAEGVTAGAADDVYLKSIPFFGFVGMNYAVAAKTGGKDWRRKLAEISSSRISLAAKYHRGLLNKSLLLDSWWGEVFSDDSKLYLEERRTAQFDYDTYHPYNEENINRILAAKDMNLVSKCGILARYCLLHGNDKQEWQELKRDEMRDRIEDATRAVAKVLNNEFQPDVELLDKLGDNSNMLGLCCCNGQLIKYKYSAAKDYDGLVRTICHECYHGFQYTAISNGWKQWHYLELGVNKWKVDTWITNNAKYISSSENYNHYFHQIMEADARIFAAEAVNAASIRWSEITLRNDY